MTTYSSVNRDKTNYIFTIPLFILFLYIGFFTLHSAIGQAEDSKCKKYKKPTRELSMGSSDILLSGDFVKQDLPDERRMLRSVSFHFSMTKYKKQRLRNTNEFA